MAEWLCFGGPMDGEKLILPDTADLAIEAIIKLIPHDDAGEPDPSRACYYRRGAGNSLHHDPSVKSCP